MDRQPELHKLLCSIPGVEHVYFDPPESVKMQYPAIVYSLSNIRSTFANNEKYMHRYSYTLTAIDYEPDSSIIEEVLKLPYCRFSKAFKADNLNHFVFEVYY